VGEGCVFFAFLSLGSSNAQLADQEVCALVALEVRGVL
jgi:hypothetical protein